MARMDQSTPQYPQVGDTFSSLNSLLFAAREVPLPRVGGLQVSLRIIENLPNRMLLACNKGKRSKSGRLSTADAKRDESYWCPFYLRAGVDPDSNTRQYIVTKSIPHHTHHAGPISRTSPSARTRSRSASTTDSLEVATIRALPLRRPSASSLLLPSLPIHSASNSSLSSDFRPKTNRGKRTPDELDDERDERSEALVYSLSLLNIPCCSPRKRRKCLASFSSSESVTPILTDEYSEWQQALGVENPLRSWIEPPSLASHLPWVFSKPFDGKLRSGEQDTTYENTDDPDWRDEEDGEEEEPEPVAPIIKRRPRKKVEVGSEPRRFSTRACTSKVVTVSPVREAEPGLEPESELETQREVESAPTTNALPPPVESQIKPQASKGKVQVDVSTEFQVESRFEPPAASATPEVENIFANVVVDMSDVRPVAARTRKRTQSNSTTTTKALDTVLVSPVVKRVRRRKSTFTDLGNEEALLKPITELADVGRGEGVVQEVLEKKKELESENKGGADEVVWSLLNLGSSWEAETMEELKDAIAKLPDDSGHWEIADGGEEVDRISFVDEDEDIVDIVDEKKGFEEKNDNLKGKTMDVDPSKAEDVEEEPKVPSLLSRLGPPPLPTLVFRMPSPPPNPLSRRPSPHKTSNKSSPTKHSYHSSPPKPSRPSSPPNPACSSSPPRSSLHPLPRRPKTPPPPGVVPLPPKPQSRPSASLPANPKNQLPALSNPPPSRSLSKPYSDSKAPLGTASPPPEYQRQFPSPSKSDQSSYSHSPSRSNPSHSYHDDRSHSRSERSRSDSRSRSHSHSKSHSKPHPSSSATSVHRDRSPRESGSSKVFDRHSQKPPSKSEGSSRQSLVVTLRPSSSREGQRAPPPLPAVESRSSALDFKPSKHKSRPKNKRHSASAGERALLVAEASAKEGRAPVVEKEIPKVDFLQQRETIKRVKAMLFRGGEGPIDASVVLPFYRNRIQPLTQVQNNSMYSARDIEHKFSQLRSLDLTKNISLNMAYHSLLLAKPSSTFLPQPFLHISPLSQVSPIPYERGLHDAAQYLYGRKLGAAEMRWLEKEQEELWAFLKEMVVVAKVNKLVKEIRDREKEREKEREKDRDEPKKRTWEEERWATRR